MMFQVLCNLGQLTRKVGERLDVREFLTVAETADLLRLSQSKVYSLIAEGKLGAYSLGGAKRIPLVAILEFLERSET